MDRSGKRCLACGYNGDGHYTHCNIPTKANIAANLRVLDGKLERAEGDEVAVLAAYKLFVAKMRTLAGV